MSECVHEWHFIKVEPGSKSIGSSNDIAWFGCTKCSAIDRRELV